MCFFKKKKKVSITGNKYQLGQDVRFRYRDSMCPGVIYEIKLDSNGNVIYDIQLGGECPIVVKDVKEEIIEEKESRRI